MTLRVSSPRTHRKNRERRALANLVVPESPVAVDVVIPFHADAAKYLTPCLEAIDAQLHCAPVVHLIADNCEFPTLPNISAEMYRYTHSRKPGQGPYRLTNALAAGGHLRTDFIGIQDADDISLPDRFWMQIGMLRATGATMISSIAQNFIDDEFADNATLIGRWRNQPRVIPGIRQAIAPWGSCVNPSKTMRRSLFDALNGFAKLFCSGDYEFDCRAHRGGFRIIDDCDNVHVLRRLHGHSITNELSTWDSARRKLDTDQIRRMLNRVKGCRSCVKNFGALNLAFPLEVV